MQTLQFTLTIDETNLILRALGNLPYMEVHQLIQKIHAQATEQMNGNSVSPANPSDFQLPS
jgi:hypothetical protein